MKECTATEATGAVTGGLRIILRLEGLALFAGMTLLYAIWGGSWWVYFILFLMPDISFAAYLSGPRFGAAIYNAMHSYLIPVPLMVAGFGLQAPLLLSVGFIWLAHIGIDRALGYGLKYSTGFAFTHLGRIGKAGLAAPEPNRLPGGS
ncbi:MAG: DUF4260 family protein [Bradyrhizobium sp.]|nr:DUF4260 family protein [Bradyrhizobium sp.]